MSASGPNAPSLVCPEPLPLLLPQENLAGACESIKKIRADMGGTNLLPPLKWALRQPIQRGHPRLLFLLTDGAVGNTGKILALLRSHAFSTRWAGGASGPPSEGQIWPRA